MGSATKLPPHLLGGADVLIALGCVVLVVVVMKINNDFAVRQDISNQEIFLFSPPTVT